MRQSDAVRKLICYRVGSTACMGEMKMKSKSLARILFSLTTLGVSAHLFAQVAAQAIPMQRPGRSLSYAQLPLTFERNQGQADSQVKFLARGTGYSAFLTSGGIVLSLRPAGASFPVARDQAAKGKSAKVEKSILQFKLLGAVQHPQVVGEDVQPGVANYFIGKDPKKWRTNVPTYAQVRYRNVY